MGRLYTLALYSAAGEGASVTPPFAWPLEASSERSRAKADMAPAPCKLH